MVWCFLDSSPIDGNVRNDRSDTWAVSMKDAPCKEPAWCCLGFFCPCCTVYMQRKKALGGTIEGYVCCQGYFDQCCFKAGNMGDQDNECCLCCEALCCTSLGASATRLMIMDQKDLMPDPCDNQIIRCNNYLQCLACLCSIAAIFMEELREASQIINLIADCVALTILGCIAGQVNGELKLGQVPKGVPGQFDRWGAPAGQVMDRQPPPQHHAGHATQPMAVAQPVHQPQQFMVQCPLDAGPGQQIMAQSPTGQQFMVVVPAGVPPGGAFPVSF